MDTECAVCLSQVLGSQCTTRCGHVFHSECIFRAIKSDDRCPLCRTRLVEDVQPEQPEHGADERQERQARAQYMARRRRVENTDAEVAAARDSWLGAELSYNHQDAVVEDLVRDFLAEAFASDPVRLAKHRRVCARRKAQRGKGKYRRLLEGHVGEVPEGVLDSILSRHVRSAASGERAALSMRSSPSAEGDADNAELELQGGSGETGDAPPSTSAGTELASDPTSSGDDADLAV